MTVPGFTSNVDLLYPGRARYAWNRGELTLPTAPSAVLLRLTKGPDG
ncbi:hypothetical protein ACFQ1S_34870 [Kibdelosporangium lantanae]|uniref:Uncharacterized protein n=1 Tax=Kibdelosporangium lantanae TaxID=1497396 RepID=A0ABW3MI95_9PSEU